MSVVGVIIVGALILGFDDHFAVQQLNIGFACVIIGYGLLALQARSWLLSPDKETDYPKSMVRFQLILLLLGFCWAIILIVAIRVGTPDQRGMIYALAIALISTTMISGPARYALSFWAPVTLGSYAAFISDSPAFFAPILIALTAYSLLSLFSILSLNAKMFERELNLVEVANQRDTIGLLLRDFQEGSGSFLWESNANLRVTQFSEQIDLTTGHIGNVLAAIATPPGAAEPAQSNEALQQIAVAMRERAPFKDVVIRAYTKSGARWWSLAGKPVFNADTIFIGYRGLCTDVTEREDYRQRIEFNANRDYLTKTYNRAAFTRILAELCTPPILSNTGAPQTSALLCLDLDRFKTVNDNYGHAIGDRLLLAVAGRIGACVRGQDHVFRLGGDEFAVLIPQATEAEAIAVAQRLIKALIEPFRLTSLATSVSVTIGVSIGIALTPTDSSNPEILHHCADLALYRAKSTGGNHCCCYDAALDDRHSRNQTLQLELSRAVERQQLSLVFQPIVNLKTGAIVAAEALLRWTHPAFGSVPPDRFVPMLEQIGQVSAVGHLVKDCAFRTAALIRPDIAIAINLSALQLADPDLPTRIAENLARNALPAPRIEFEVTETSLLDDDPQKLSILHAIRALGCRIALDDFGTGYSSLRLLDKFPFDKLKIDGSFIHDPTDSDRRVHILASMIELGHKLGITVTGEGIETAEQAARLAALGCHDGQGFLFSRPIPMDEFREKFSDETASAPQSSLSRHTAGLRAARPSA
jgi:diguanylate cyclase (GGDEF)-like protein